MVMTSCPRRIILSQKRLEKCHTYIELQAFAGACVQLTSSIAKFRISAEHNYMEIVVKYYDLFILSHLENASIMRRKVATNLGPVSRELHTFRVYFGCHKSRPIFKMTTFRFKSSKFTINPLFSHSKHLTRSHFGMSYLIGPVCSYYKVPRDWLRKQSTHSKKQQKE